MSVRREIAVVGDVAQAAAERIAGAVGAGRHIALSGGSTPKAAHERTAALGLDWGGVTVWFSDDRAVGPEDEFSNYRMARETLLDRIEGEPPRVERVKGELGYAAAADDYEQRLRAAFGGQAPRIDLLMLGIGPDAHTASLFPGDDALGLRDRWVVGVPVPGMAPLVPRVSFTLAAIDAAREVLFLIAGAEKADAVARAFGDAPGPDAPASLVAPDPGRLTVLLDAAAAARLGSAA